MLDPQIYAQLDAMLVIDDAERARLYPGHASTWQPMHTVYVPADQFDAQTVTRWGEYALATLDEYGPPEGVSDEIESLIRTKLSTEPIEDLRVDFEDGYGLRPDEVEDAHARDTAIVLQNMAAVPFVGIRIKSLEPATRLRGIRTLELVIDTMRDGGTAPWPAGFRVTLPKVTSRRQVEAMVVLCQALESVHNTAFGFELQIETPQAILAADGTATVATMVHAAKGRCIGLHYGTYDYSASLGVAAMYQSMEHPVADHAKAVMLVAAAGTGVPVSDGSTNVIPIGDRAAVQTAWSVHMHLVHRSLERGFYQGWDLHPAQLVSRFAATFSFYRRGWTGSADRLRDYLARTSSGTLDEPATAQALAGFLLRSIRCGAVDADEVCSRVGAGSETLLSLAEGSRL